MPIPNWDRVPIDLQAIDAPLSSDAIFLTLRVADGDAALKDARALIGGVGDLVKSVGFRDLDAKLSCIVSLGAALWDRLSPDRRPRGLAPFRALQGPVHDAPATPGDILLHIRANRRDLCFELERLILDQAGPGLSVEDESVGFRYFDARDLLGFVDGSANPVGTALPKASMIGDDDPDFAGGSYVTNQKYLHDLAAWKAMTVERQEAVVGRTKLDDVELPDAGKDEQKSHKTLCTITDENGVERDILRDNMPFGSPAEGTFGTVFIAYAADQILDVSKAVTGAAYFAPSADWIKRLGDG